MKQIIATCNASKQNKVTYVVDDVIRLIRSKPVEAITEDDIYTILLNRGVFKCIAARRELIKIKNDLKLEVKMLLAVLKLNKPRLTNLWGSKKNTQVIREVAYDKGCLHVIDGYKKHISDICHSDRVRVADNDRRAHVWLFQKLYPDCINCDTNEKECPYANRAWDDLVEQRTYI
jgi:hypothetical protein